MANIILLKISALLSASVVNLKRIKILFLLSFLSVFPPHFNPFFRGGFWIGAREKKREGACFPLEVKTALELAGARPQAAACASQAEASYRLLYTFVFPFCIDL